MADVRLGRSTRGQAVLLGFGAAAMLLAVASILELLQPRPWDGVVLESDVPGVVEVRHVVPGTGGAAGGIERGDRIVGIDRTILLSVTHAAELLGRHDVGDVVPYLLRGPAGLREVGIELGPRRIASASYLSTSALGFAFFLVGLFVLRRQPDLKAARVFFALSVLFLLFLVCRLRPASYSWFDGWVLGAGTLALLGLPPAFLHFFMLFPRPVALWADESPAGERRRTLFSAGMYLLPLAVLLVGVAGARARGRGIALISGAPAANWWVLAAYMLAGLAILRRSASRIEAARERRGATLVFLGAVFGVLPFLVLAVGFPSFLRTERFLLYGTLPLALVPLTFAYAIVRFGLMEIRILLRRSLLYTLTTAALTGAYALGIGVMQRSFGASGLASTFPIVYAIAIVLMFEPVRRRLQVSVDTMFQAEETRLRQALVDMGKAFAEELDLEEVVRELVEELPRILGVRFAALYLMRDPASAILERRHGPAGLPLRLELPEELRELLAGRLGAVRLDELRAIEQEAPAVAALRGTLARSEVEVVADLATSRRLVGLVLLSGKTGQLDWERLELELLEGLLHQAAMALETSLLLEERTRQAELERDVEIAARVQAALLPAELDLGPGWVVAASCRPARHVGGDFYTALPGPGSDGHALVFGDVAGKSVSAALLMMASHEILHTLAMTHRDPEELIRLANRRLYALGPRKSFVALCYLAAGPGEVLRYILAGQPQPLLRTTGGKVTELPLPEHRIPLGALDLGSHRSLEVTMQDRDLVLGYSDGVLDARSPSGEAFGFDRLVRVVAEAPAEPREVVDRLLGALSEFTRGAEPYDDVTLVAVARRALPPPGSGHGSGPVAGAEVP